MPPSKQVVYPHQFGHCLVVANLTSQYRGHAVQAVLLFTEGVKRLCQVVLAVLHPMAND
jgi:hypothetical protein